MKYAIQVFAGFLAWTTALFAGDHSDRSFYEKLSATTFVTIACIGDTTIPKEEMSSFYRDGASLAFSYWIHTRKGSVPPSEKVDAAIAMLYEKTLDKEMSFIFEDPLSRSKFSDPERVGVSGFETMSTIQYKEYIKEFKGFLDEVLDTRASRLNP